jgi:outer membrane protein assembly complex protein YaeT
MKWAALILALGLSTASAQDENLDRALAGADLLLGALKPAAESKVQLRGATAFTDEELRTAIGEQIREIDELGATPARADDAAYYVGAFYRKAGFAKVETGYEITGSKVTVRITEGPRTQLRGLSFTGNAAYPAAQLFEYMIGATPERFAEEADLFPYHAGEVAAGADRVRGFYVSEGFLDAAVEPGEPKLSGGGTRAEIVVRVTEGPRYTFGALAFTGQILFPVPKLIAAVRERPDGPFSKTKVVAMQRNLETWYRAQGYFLAKVEVTADPKAALITRHPQRGRQVEVPVTFHITPGAPHRFDGVTVKNTTRERTRLRDSFVPRRFRHLQGQTYDPAKIDEQFRELLRTGLFTNLRLSPLAQPDHTVRLDFEIEEAKAREVGFTLGYGTYDGYKIGLRLADKNLLGTGRPLGFSADYTQRGIIADLEYRDPWLFDQPRLSLRARLFTAARQELGYTKTEHGGRLELGWKPRPQWEIGVFGQAGTVAITQATIDPLLLGPTDYQYTSVGLTQTLDFRDSPMAPTRGWILTTAWDTFLVDGQPSFTRGLARFSWYVPIGKCQLALGARAGAIQPIIKPIPIDAKFFNGGASTVRSFAERELGPKDPAGNPLGGEFYTVGNAEFTFPIAGGLQAAVFLDAGNLTEWERAGLSDLRYAAGLGLRYALPVGPLRLDYGINPSPREGEAFGAFHFSFGAAF